MLKNAPTLAIVAVHTAENEPLKVLGVIQFNIQSTPYPPFLLDEYLGRGAFRGERRGARREQ